eukprot:jgi/Hompol1/4613/HPOL_000578-RA
MGSQNSFKTFPQDLKSMLREQYAIGVDSSLHFEYKTKGANDDAVAKLVEFIHNNHLEQIAAGIQHPPDIILLAHSMGGPLSLDASRIIDTTATDLYSNSGAAPPRIRAVISFDSPFFGLHPNVFADTGIQRAQGAIKTATGVLDMIGKVAATASQPIAANASSSTAAGGAARSAGSAATATTASSSSSTSGGTLALSVALTLGAAAAASYASNAAVRQTVNSIAKDQAKAAYEHMQFLGPLWKVDNQLKRFEQIPQALFFHGFFLKVGVSAFSFRNPSLALQYLVLILVLLDQLTAVQTFQSSSTAVLSNATQSPA